MIIEINEAKELCDWLIQRNVGIGEAAQMLCNIELGDSFALALLKVFIERKKLMEKLHEKTPVDWGNPTAY